MRKSREADIEESEYDTECMKYSCDELLMTSYKVGIIKLPGSY